MTLVNLTVNGQERECDVPDGTLLVHLLRDHLGMTGTHVGCDTSQCGACTVILNGEAVKSCTILAASVGNAELQTVEGLAEGDSLHDVQTAFRTHHGLQCGFCTPGMIMAAVNMIDRHKGQLDETLVRHDLEGNLCRCTGYHNIVKAILSAAETYRARHQAAMAQG
ncbi:(2Fe-2S)-binding protein [Paracoccus onubensis]|uniref:(2Fe-2S)-binding protein n=1 Tax=Paracoccus onubensis TaxID=1675788 RepID=UPI002730175C|nr:(2Fe-2S)-binding protein [Paracoccus onubensis]MDP0926623.1 (2Fe-2S)-binding protein [Paracoccus onubensis]